MIEDYVSKKEGELEQDLLTAILNSLIMETYHVLYYK